MIFKTACPYCRNNIEHDENAIGVTIECPHCSDKFPIIPNSFTAKQGSKTKTRKLIIITLISFAATGLFIGVLFIFRKYGDIISNIAGVALPASLYAVLAIFVLFWAVLWVLFPVFVYFGMGRMEKILNKIEVNTRRK